MHCKRLKSATNDGSSAPLHTSVSVARLGRIRRRYTRAWTSTGASLVGNKAFAGHGQVKRGLFGVFF